MKIGSSGNQGSWKNGLGAIALLAWFAAPLAVTGCGSAADVTGVGEDLTQDTSGGEGSDESDDSSSDDQSEDGDGVDSDSAASDDDNYELRLSAPELQSGYVKSDRYSSTDESASLKCDDDAYVSKIGVEYTDFGTSKAITYIEVECTDVDGDVETFTGGVRVNAYGFLNELTCSNPGWTGTGFGAYIPGIKVLSDNYVKNLQVKCASIEVSSSASYAFRDHYTVEMTSSDPYYWSWVYPDGVGDEEDSRDCGENEVLSGVKIRYAHDTWFTDEAAITKIEYYCSEISAASTEGFSLGGILAPSPIPGGFGGGT